MLSAISSAIHWRLGKANKGKDKQKFANHIFEAVKDKPHQHAKLRRAVGLLVDEKMYGRALELCDRKLAGDTSGFWTHYRTFVEELARAKSSNGNFKLALFNDTDFRVNIGCRLTSQGLKDQIRKTFPEAAITSLGFRFSAFRENFDASIAVKTPNLDELKNRLRVAYGDKALDTISESSFVVLQPEGSLDHKSTMEGLATFFTPALLAQQIGKPYAVLNGTIPIYSDERDVYLRTLFETLKFVAARDEISASHHNVGFLPDAAFLRIPPRQTSARDGCLITTGARNDAADDIKIFKAAIDACGTLSLRPIVLTHAVDRLAEFERDIVARGGIFAETASIEKAAETLSRCCLHIGGRFHMAIFSILCHVPTLLFDVKTHKNQWLAQYSPLVCLVKPGSDLKVEARTFLDEALDRSSPRVVGYEEFLAAAYSAKALR